MILALSGLSLKTSIDRVATIFAVDLSESTRNDVDEIRTFIESSLEYMDDRDEVGIVTFGENGEVEIPLSKELNRVDFQTNPGEGFTNIQKGLSISQALLPENANKRVILMTDGEENLGNSMEEGSILQHKNIDFKIYAINKTESAEVQIQDIEVPKILHENQSFDVLVKIYSNIKTNAKVTLYSDRTIVGESEVIVEEGMNRFIFKDQANKSGFKSYRAVITPERDSFTENNDYSTYTEIKGKPSILLVDGESNGAREIEKLFNSSGLNISHIKDRELPRTLSELTKYSAIVMSDVSLENVNNGFINSIKGYVRDYGGGLVVTGGENSFALGGYYKTPLEEVLPVDMEMKINGEVPSLGLMLVIDKSGSMGGSESLSKIELAKEAAIKAVDSLKVKDQIGVVAFDGAAQWVVDVTGIQDKDAIKNSIGTIRAGGGTSIIPALDEAYLALKDVETKLKHIILLTDGHAESAGYDQLLENIREDGITISTVAVGDGADQYLLENIAEIGKGRYYFVNDYTSIPQIFTKETFLASKSYINNRTFTPTARYIHEMINPLLNGIPNLDGYISTSRKDRAETILTSDKDEPILAAWQYGLGRSVAWTSDTNGKWTSQYLTTDEGIEFMKNMLEWTLPRTSSDNLIVESNKIGSIQEVIVTNTNEFDEDFITKATIISPDNTKKEVELLPDKPGEYKMQFPLDEKGVYIVKVNQYKDGDIVNTANHGISVNYSKEYDFSSSVNRLNSLANRGNGTFISNPEDVFNDNFDDIYGFKNLSRILMIIALLLFIIDIAIRRLNLNLSIVNKISNKFSIILKRLKRNNKQPRKSVDREESINKLSSKVKEKASMKMRSNDSLEKKSYSGDQSKDDSKDFSTHNHRANKNIKEKNSTDKVNEVSKKNSRTQEQKNNKDSNLNTSRLLKAKDKKKK
nr:VWA domain-containing protein [Sporosalibacterium faouarense]